MRRRRQTVDELLNSLSHIQTSWKDQHAEGVTRVIDAIPKKAAYGLPDIECLLEHDFEAGLTAIRLVLELSKDELSLALKESLGPGGVGVTRYRNDRGAYLASIERLGVIQAMQELVNTPVSWRNVLIERLKSGRGSAIKGQARGRFLEDFTEAFVERVFSDVGFDTRCRFVGASGTSTEKADFAIPSKQDPRILIEVKAYGATGSKQTDVLGDIARIADQKRHDTHLLLVTDGSRGKLESMTFGSWSTCRIRALSPESTPRRWHKNWKPTSVNSAETTDSDSAGIWCHVEDPDSLGDGMRS